MCTERPTYMKTYSSYYIICSHVCIKSSQTIVQKLNLVKIKVHKMKHIQRMCNRNYISLSCKTKTSS